MNGEGQVRPRGQIDFVKLLWSWALTALGVLLAAKTSEGVTYDSRSALIVAVLLISLFNMVIRPLLILFALPFVIITLGFGMVVINALVLLLVEAVVPGFHLASFWSALWAAIVISIVSLIANMLMGKSRVKVRVTRGPGGGQGGPKKDNKKLSDDDVIDI